MQPGATSQTGGQAGAAETGAGLTGQGGVTGQAGLTGQTTLTGQEEQQGAFNATIAVIQGGVSGTSVAAAGVGAGQTITKITQNYAFCPAGYNPRVCARQKKFLDQLGFATVSK